MRSVAIWAVVFMLTAGRSGGDDFFRAGHELYPNHLVPMKSAMQGRRSLLGDYDALLIKHLFVTDSELARMLVRPSFSSEFCLSVDAEQIEHADTKNDSSPLVGDPFENGDTDGRRVETKDSRNLASVAKSREDRYSITVTTAVESIWEARYKAEKTGKPVSVKIDRVRREISRNLAVAIQRVWAKALLLTRYPAVPEEKGPVFGSGFDGTTYQFFTRLNGFGTIEGKTWSPTKGLPLELTRVGLDLVSFARQDANGKKITEESLVDRLRKLESTIPEP